jgi:selenocysteine-specific elongation factor
MRQEELRSRLNLPAELFNLVMAQLAEERRVVESGTDVRLSGHEIEFSPAQAKATDDLLKRLAKGRYSPPALDQLCEELGLDEEIIAALVERGDLVRASVSVAFAKPVFDDMVARLRRWFADHQSITVAEWRDLTGTSRKFGLAFLEYLDQRRITRRVGDVRHLR